jgi:hypothetical protein
MFTWLSGMRIHSAIAPLLMPGSGERTENDNREVQQRKQEIEQMSHEEWIKMSNRHLLGQEHEQDE